MKIEDIQNPHFLRDMSLLELTQLCEDIRSFLVTSISKTGGHLSSNLGVVELTVALHAMFDSPHDKILFDVGHQAYIHKILTGRAKEFSTLRQYHGLSGFIKRHESEHDVWEAGHSSTSLSAALGFAIARDQKKEKSHIIAFIGDGALGGGMALEALNHIGEKQTNLIIVLNDNEMSISPNVGAIGSILGRMRMSPFYRHSKSELKETLTKSTWGKGILHSLQAMKDIVKKNVVDGSFFKELGIEYLGPINGHDIASLKRAFQAAKEHSGPIVVHVNTIKGKGYSFAQEDRTGKWHGVGRFDPQTGKSLVVADPDTISYSELVTKTLLRLKPLIPHLQVLTPAMRGGSKLDEFFEQYPESSFDCGIAEQHTLGLAAGFAQSGLRPFAAVYSSFVQRAYDQINHDIARPDLPVVIGLDRSGLVGEDGETHHGVFDISFLRSLPNLIIAQPKDHIELQQLMYTAFQQNHPFVVRFPRGNTKREYVEQFEAIPIGSHEVVYEGQTVTLVVVAYGETVDAIVLEAIKQQWPICVINARFIKPLDTNLLNKYATRCANWLVIERDMLAGGLSSAILEHLHDHQYTINMKRIGIGDHFVEQGDIQSLFEQEGISDERITAVIMELLHG